MDFKIHLVGQRVALFIDSSIMRQGGNKGVREGAREGGEEMEGERKREVRE